MQDAILSVKDLEIQFTNEEGSNTAVKKISFDVLRGETLGIVGESGSGKSVTSLAIMRLLQSPPARISNGSIDFFPKGNTTINLLTLEEKALQSIRGNQISMIFQEPMTSLNPVMRCGLQVDEVLIWHKKLSKEAAKQETLRLFESVKLPDPLRAYKAYPHELSGGQKQRVMIAMAMACEPALLIADEPTTALDVTVQKTILELMKSLKAAQQMSMMFITHDLGVIAEIADRVVVMYRGQIVEQGTVEDIFMRPQHPYTQGLLACRPPLEYKLKKLPTIQDFIQANNTTTENGASSTFKAKMEANIISTATITARNAFLKNQNALLEVKNLKVYYPKNKNWLGTVTDWVKAVDDVSFEVKKGETLGLVGESGCGKTTLSRAILKLTHITDGTLRYAEQDISTWTAAQMRPLRKDIQIIFQDPYSSLNPRMTIGEAITEPMLVHQLHQNQKQRKEKALALLETVGLEAKYFDRYPHEFSGGQRQRVVIARALAVEPRFVICDECVSALDVSVQAQVLNLLMELRSQMDLTYIFISHDLSVVKLMSDRIMVMNQGKIVELDTAENVYNSPQNPYTQHLIDSIPRGNIFFQKNL